MTALHTVRESLLHPFGTDDIQLQAWLSHLLSSGADFADVYFQRSVSESWALEDSLVKDASYQQVQGVGVRACAGEKTGFSYSNSLQPTDIAQAVGLSRRIVRAGAAGTCAALQPTVAAPLYGETDPLSELSSAAKVALLQHLDAYARGLDTAVRDVQISLAGQWQWVLVAATDGTLAADIRPLVRLSVTVYAERDGRRERGSSGGGGRYGYGRIAREDAEGWVREAVRLALLTLDAGDAPAGVMPVVLGPGWPGVLLHEAVGHGLEADFNRKGSSAFAGRLGEQVASPLCTVVDDGTLPQRRGSLSMDDEGVPAQSTTLIENGILRGYLQDKFNARLMGMPLTGNGRRQSYAHLPMPRMRNTFMLAGQNDPAEMIASIDRGLYAVNFGGGQVDIASGNFVFTASEAYRIEGGKLAGPVKGATLIGNGPDVMRKISRVGPDLALDRGVGVCGKNGQSVPVGVGQPSLKIDALTVGGTE